MSWYAHSKRNRDSGKFRHLRRAGTEKSSAGSYRGWNYELIRHETGSSIRRPRFSASVRDPHGHRAQYLRDFSSAEQAGSAAREWIDEVLRKMEAPSVS